MAKNESFDAVRYWQLVGWHWTQNRKGYLLSALAIPGLLLTWMGFCLMIGGYHPLSESTQYITYDFGLYITGCWYASTLFGDLGVQPKGIHYLSIPASHLEKLLCAILFGVVLLFVYYTLAFYMADIPMLKIANSIGLERFRKDHIASDPYLSADLVNLLGSNNGFNDQGFLYVFAAYFPVQSAFLLGSVYFARYAFIKTTIVLLLLWLLLFVVLFEVFIHLMPESWKWADLDEWEGFDADGQSRMVRLAPWVHQLLAGLIKFGITIFLWVITYFRLKEKEI